MLNSIRRILRFESQLQIAEPKSQEIIESVAHRPFKSQSKYSNRKPIAVTPIKMFKSHCVDSNRGQIAKMESSKPPQSVMNALYFASV